MPPPSVAAELPEIVLLLTVRVVDIGVDAAAVVRRVAGDRAVLDGQGAVVGDDAAAIADRRVAGDRAVLDGQDPGVPPAPEAQMPPP